MRDPRETCTADGPWSLDLVSFKVSSTLGFWATWELFWGQKLRLLASIAQRSYRRGGIGLEGRWEQVFPDQLGLLPGGGQPHSLWSQTEWLSSPGYRNKKLKKVRDNAHYSAIFSGSKRRDFSINSLLPSPIHPQGRSSHSSDQWL